MKLLPKYKNHIDHGVYISNVWFSPNGQFLVTKSSNTVWIVDTKTGVKKTRLGGGDVDVELSPDGLFLATASNSGTVRVIEVSTGKEVANIAHSKSIQDMKFSPDGLFLATASNSGTVRVIEVSTGKEVANIAHSKSIQDMKFSPDGLFLVTASHNSLLNKAWDVNRDATVVVLEVATGDVTTRVNYGSRGSDMNFSPNGNFLAITGDGSIVQILEVASGKKVLHIDYQENVSSLKFSPDGKLFATTSNNGITRV